jgi:hypothetical protein
MTSVTTATVLIVMREKSMTALRMLDSSFAVISRMSTIRIQRLR